MWWDKRYSSKWHTGSCQLTTNDFIGLVQNTEELRCFAIPSRTGRHPGLFVLNYHLELAGPYGYFLEEERVWSLVAEGGQTQELKTCL